MIQRFENLTLGVTRIYKSIQKIKKYELNHLGIKGTQLMCIYYLDQHPEGLTATDLCSLCVEDKAAMSRILSDLESQKLIRYNAPAQGKRYRAEITLTDDGIKIAAEISGLILDAVSLGGQGLTDQERDIFYRTLFQIADNLDAVCACLN